MALAKQSDAGCEGGEWIHGWRVGCKPRIVHDGVAGALVGRLGHNESCIGGDSSFPIFA